MIDLGSMTDKFSEAGQKVARRAIEVSKRYDHNFLLEEIADGAVGYSLSGPTNSLCLIMVQVKREPQIQDPLTQLYGAMLAAARMNWAQDNRVPHEIYGCYTVADNWIFAHGLVADFEALQPTMGVALSRAFSGTAEAETILRILKSITAKYAQKWLTPPEAHRKIVPK